MFRFQPIPKERLWGGCNLAKHLDRTLPVGKKIGESWEIVDRPEAQSIITEGPFKGFTLRELIKSNTAKIMGPRFSPEKPFPILVKWLDCQERLSLQVHPPASIAPKLKAQPKTEFWYIAHAEKNAAILAGLKQGVTRASFEKALHQRTVENIVSQLDTYESDCIFIPSGRLHAIDAGNFILEIQQNSDTTYRVYDWDRVGLDGRPRTLHIEASLRSINFNDFEPTTLKAEKNGQILVDCPFFRIRHFIIKSNELSLKFLSNEQPRLLHVIKGQLQETNQGNLLTTGDNVLLPYKGTFQFKAKKESKILISDNFVLP